VSGRTERAGVGGSQEAQLAVALLLVRAVGDEAQVRIGHPPAQHPRDLQENGGRPRRRDTAPGQCLGAVAFTADGRELLYLGGGNCDSIL
jgi:hypothetical protein